MMLAELVAEGRVRLVDGTLISCANYPGCASRSHFAGAASYGYCASKSQFLWGMRLVLICDPKGVPVGYDLVGPKTGEERECALGLAAGQAGALLFADGGFWGREYRASMEALDVELVTPDKHRLGERPPAEVAKHTYPAGDRVGVLHAEAPDAIGDALGQDGRRARSTDCPATAGAHPRRLHEHPSRPSTTGTCRLRRAVNPHQASRRGLTAPATMAHTGSVP